MKTYHILNGDALKAKVESASIPGELIICRECLIEGKVNAKSIKEFWNVRAEHISKTYDVSVQEYYDRCVSEFDKIGNLPENSEINLWFENDLFCQANMWFVLSLLSTLRFPLNIYRVFPVIKNRSDVWKGFGVSNDEMLKQSLDKRVKFQKSDLRLGYDLWLAYKTKDLKLLERFSHTNSNCFQYLGEVCRAHIERFPENGKPGRPERVMLKITDSYSKTFDQVFKEFSEKEGIYGFGDLQLKSIYERFNNSIDPTTIV